MNREHGLKKPKNRNLLSTDEFEYLKTNINSIGKMLNGYIKAIGKYPENNKLEESQSEYYVKDDDLFSE